MLYNNFYLHFQLFDVVINWAGFELKGLETSPSFRSLSGLNRWDQNDNFDINFFNAQRAFYVKN